MERQIAIWEWDQDRRPILVDDRLQALLGWVLRSDRNLRWTGADEIRTAPAIKLVIDRVATLPEGRMRVTIGYRFTSDDRFVSIERGRMATLASFNSSS